MTFNSAEHRQRIKEQSKTVADYMNTKLSPAAEAVLDAFRSSHTGPGCLAAALRTARDELAPSKTIEDIDYVPQSYVDGYNDALDEILSIAIQLEVH